MTGAVGALWLLRLLMSLVGLPAWQRVRRAARQKQSDALEGRSFQTGDVLLCGSPASLASCCAEFETLSQWGHAAMVVRSPPFRVRVAFALGQWLSRLPPLRYGRLRVKVNAIWFYFLYVYDHGVSYWYVFIWFY